MTIAEHFTEDFLLFLEETSNGKSRLLDIKNLRNIFLV